jgi:RND family efflux transporter MFP subunit
MSKKNIAKLSSVVGVIGILLVSQWLLAGSAEEQMGTAMETDIVEAFVLGERSGVEEVRFPGTLDAHQRTLVSAETSGIITDMFVDFGDEVNAGEELLRIAGDEVQVQWTSLAQQQRSLEQLYVAQEALYNEQIAQAQNGVDTAAIQYAEAVENIGFVNSITADQVTLAQEQLTEAELTLMATQERYQLQEEVLLNSAPILVSQARSTNNDAIFLADQLLAVSVEYSYLTYEYDHLLGAQSGGTSAAKALLRNAISAQDAINVAVRDGGSLDQWVEELSNIHEALSLTRSALVATMNVLEGTPSSDEFTSTEIAASITQFTTMLARLDAILLTQGIDGSQSGVQGFLSSVEMWKVGSVTDVILAQQGVERAQAALELLESQAGQQVYSQTTNADLVSEQVSTAEHYVEMLMAQRDAELERIRIQMHQNAEQLNLAAEKVEDTRSGSPYGGVVTKRYKDVGEFVSPGELLFEVIDPSILKMVIDVSSEQVSQFEVGSEVRIDVDTVGVIVGTVSRRAPAVDLATKSLQVEVEIENTQRELIAGLYAEVLLEMPTEGFLIPHAYMRRDQDGYYVLRMNGEKVPVTLHATTQEYVIINTEALMPGEEIVL